MNADMLLAAFSEAKSLDPLIALVGYCRERGWHRAGLLLADAALRAPCAVEEEHRLRSEVSILAYYCDERAPGFAACEWIALGRGVDPNLRNLARRNVLFYALPLEQMAPSLRMVAPKFTPPAGYCATNPSIAVVGGRLRLAIRCVNYRIVSGRYVLSDADEVIRTRNFLLTLDASLAVQDGVEIQPPIDLPPPQFPKIVGFEDLRLIPAGSDVWALCTTRQFTAEAWAQMVLLRIAADGRIDDWRVVERPGPRLHEKNWTPLLDDGPLRFLYTYDPAVVVDDRGNDVTRRGPPLAVDHFRGGSQAIRFRSGFLAVEHEVIPSPTGRYYLHRWVYLDAQGCVLRVSRPFFFRRKGIEFVAGLARHPDGRRLVVSFGVGDCEAWLAVLDEDEVSVLVGV